MPDTYKLFFDKLLVGEITDPFFSDGTWHGACCLLIDSKQGQTAKRILDYIEFSRDWNRRIAASPSNPPEASEFDRFHDVINSGLWSVEINNRERNRIINAPVFIEGKEMSWQVRQQSE